MVVRSAAAFLAAGLDPVQLARQAGIAPDPWQQAVLRSTSPRILLNCSRQSGKSTITALAALHQALFVPSSLILLLSPGLRQSAELFKKVVDAYRALGRPVRGRTETVLRLELANNSRIVALPGTESTIRGYSGAALLVVDEASRVDDGLYLSTRPMLAVSGGRLILLSTPWGKRGIFHREWTEGAGWERYEIPASLCPRIAPAFLAEERVALGEWWYRQEYECQFSDTSDQVFSTELIRSAVSAEVTPLFGGLADGVAAPSPLAG
jgi:hypothetical protein